MSSTGPSPTTIKAVQTATLFAVSAASGGSLALSFFVVPRLLESPTPLMLRQWERTFLLGRDVLPATDVVASLGFAYLAFSRAFGERAARCYAAAALLAAGIVPYTLVFMMPTNNKLFARVDQVRALADAAEDDVVEPMDKREGSKFLVDRWGVLNLGRAGLVVAASLLGLYASL